MSTYVISDIHGCYEDFMKMLKLIGLKKSDTLILAGDYIDRGPDSLKMLQYLSNRPGNVIALKGNHDKSFAHNVTLMKNYAAEHLPGFEASSPEQTKHLYDLVMGVSSEYGKSFFDYYGGIGDILSDGSVNFLMLEEWANMFRDMPCLHEFQMNNRRVIVVHAGYIDNIYKLDKDYTSPEDFYLEAREEGYQYGGVENGMIIAGHTPTVTEGMLTYTGGGVFRYHNIDIDCVFYDIDCGATFKKKYDSAKLACIRVDDEEVFYI